MKRETSSLLRRALQTLRHRSGGSVTKLWSGESTFGECPVWHSPSQKLHWLDIPSGILRAYDPTSGNVSAWKLGRPSAGLVADPASSNVLLVGQGSGLHRFDLQSASLSAFDELPEPRANERINDLKTDTSGNLWVATMDNDGRIPTGRLLRRTAKGSWQVILDEVPIVNGPALAGDGTQGDHLAGYVADTSNRRILRFNIASAQALHPVEPKLFTQFDEADGYPDGMTLDSQNCLWVAHYDGACVSRWSPDGECLLRVPTPAKHMTSVALAGDRLYMTSAARAGQHSRDDGGALFALDLSQVVT